jgi:hypothetical protein
VGMAGRGPARGAPSDGHRRHQRPAASAGGRPSSGDTGRHGRTTGTGRPAGNGTGRATGGRRGRPSRPR